MNEIMTAMTDLKRDYGDVIQRPDGSYVIQGAAGPRHIPDSGQYRAEYQQVKAYADAHPDKVTQDAPPTPPDPKAVRRAEILREFDEIDKKLVRPLSEVVVGKAADEDRARLGELIARKDTLRGELAGL